MEGWSLNINQRGQGLWEVPLSPVPRIPVTSSEGFGKVRKAERPFAHPVFSRQS